MDKKRKNLLITVNNIKLAVANNKVELHDTSVQPAVAYAARGDFHAILRYLQIPPDYYLINTIINGFNSPLDYDGRTTIKLIDASDADRLLRGV